MTEYWDLDIEEAYSKLHGETNAIEGFLIPNYEILSKLSEEDLIREIENYCKRTILKMGTKNE